MKKIEFRMMSDSEEEDWRKEAEAQHRRESPTPKCPGCGRFCHMYTYQEYNGTWNIWYVDVTCKKCGQFTEQLT